MANKKRTFKSKAPIKILKVTGTVLLSMFFIIIITGSVFVTALTIYILNYIDSTTPISLENVELNFTSRFLAENPEFNELDPESEEYTTYYTLAQDGERRVWVDLENVPKYVRDAFVYSEDERFYSHDGVDFKRTLAAFANMILHFYDDGFGGSTITQQTIKNITGDDDAFGGAGITRKIREITRSINIEKTYTKDEILESYLNIISLNTNYYNIRGVQAAANFYFSKDVSELSLGEAASLAAITKNPSKRNPYDHLDNNYERRENILKVMLKNGAISTEEYESALKEELVITGDLNFSSDTDSTLEIVKNQGVSSYYVDEAIRETIRLIQEYYGLTYSAARERLNGGGYTIKTNVDLEMQKKVEEAFKNDANFQAYGFENDELWASFVAMDYRGNVKAIVGNRGEKTVYMGWNNATQATRSPGSTIKPIASYAPAIDTDLITWSTMFKDEPIKIKQNGTEIEWPRNYSEVGNVTNWSYNYYPTYYMLQRSLNTAPAQIIQKLTPAYSYNFLVNKLHFTTLDPVADVNYSPMTVGGMSNGTTLLELVAAYQIFGNGGKYYDPHFVSQIADREGNIIYENNNFYEKAIDESSAYVMNRMLKTAVDSSNGTGYQGRIDGLDVCGKTGTSQDWQNLTFVGCTPDYVSGVWIGYENIKQIPTEKYQNIAKIWKNIFGEIANSTDNKEFKMPETVVERTYCTQTGNLASSSCTKTSVGYYKASNLPETCKGHKKQEKPNKE